MYTRQGGRVRALADRITIDADDWYHSFLVISRGSRPVVIHQDEAKPSGYRASRLLTLRYVEGTGWVAEKSEGRVDGQRHTFLLSAADGTPKPASCE